MNILIACEESGIVRDEMRKLGHNAYSCDLKDGKGQYNKYHIQDDVLKVITYKWDLMIAHPPCTYIANSGVRWLQDNRDRWEKMLQAEKFFKTLLNAPIHKIAIENPIPHKHADLPRYTQIIHPWEHGHGETKATCLWLKNLPKLQPTHQVSGRTPRIHHIPPGPFRQELRSKTYPGIAKAMAEQWTKPQNNINMQTTATAIEWTDINGQIKLYLKIEAGTEKLMINVGQKTFDTVKHMNELCKNDTSQSANT